MLTDKNRQTRDYDFFSGGGEMGALMRNHDWSATPLGPPDGWPSSLRTAIRILLTTRHPMFIWWGKDLIQFYNDAYRKTMGPERHPTALGQCGRECWAEIWDVIGPQIEFVMNGGGATWNEDQLVPVTRYGKREDVWWTYSYGPIYDENMEDSVGGVLVVCTDVTERHRAFEALARQEERLELALAAGVVGTWDWDIKRDCVVANERLAGLFGLCPKEAEAGAPIAVFFEGIHPDDRAMVKETIDHAMATKDVYQVEYRVISDSNTVRWISARGKCYFDDDGNPTRFPGAAFDITDRKAAEEHRELLSRELSHRVKNMLATVQAIANQTLKDDLPMESARNAFSARIMALSRVQDILDGKSWCGTELRTVIEAAVQHHADNSQQVQLSGPALRISARAALAFALTFHELATNAVKYGALSSHQGWVEVSWNIIPAADGDQLHLKWVENGGPPVSHPKSRGFGTRLLEGALLGEFNASSEVHYEFSGITWQLQAPLLAIHKSKAG